MSLGGTPVTQPLVVGTCRSSRGSMASETGREVRRWGRRKRCRSVEKMGGSFHRGGGALRTGLPAAARHPMREGRRGGNAGGRPACEKRFGKVDLLPARLVLASMHGSRSALFLPSCFQQIHRARLFFLRRGY